MGKLNIYSKTSSSFLLPWFNTERHAHKWLRKDTENADTAKSARFLAFPLPAGQRAGQVGGREL